MSASSFSICSTTLSRRCARRSGGVRRHRLRRAGSTRRGSPRRHEFLGIFVSQFVQVEGAAARDFQRLAQRIGGIEPRQLQARAQMALGVGGQRIAAFADRLAQADGRQRVMQRLARADMHFGQAQRGDRQRAGPCDIFHGAAMQVVAGLVPEPSGSSTRGRETPAPASVHGPPAGRP